MRSLKKYIIKKLNKSFITNFISLIVIFIGYSIPESKQEIIKTIGFFALSGSITNWLAVHMIFEKIPFIYGSGVIPNKFKEFRESIKNMIMNEFFNSDNIKKFLGNLTSTNNKNIKSNNALMEKIDCDKIFQGIKDVVIESPFGAMLGMFGGEETLNSLKEPAIVKIKEVIQGIIDDLKENNNISQDTVENIRSYVEHIVDGRVQELQSNDIKILVQNIIKEHLGWLVVWGGLFGGLIGLLASFI